MQKILRLTSFRYTTVAGTAAINSDTIKPTAFSSSWKLNRATPRLLLLLPLFLLSPRKNPELPRLRERKDRRKNPRPRDCRLRNNNSLAVRNTPTWDAWDCSRKFLALCSAAEPLVPSKRLCRLQGRPRAAAVPAAVAAATLTETAPSRPRARNAKTRGARKAATAARPRRLLPHLKSRERKASHVCETRRAARSQQQQQPTLQDLSVTRGRRSPMFGNASRRCRRRRRRCRRRFVSPTALLLQK